MAESRYNEQEISIDQQHARKEFTGQAMCHEVVHWIYFMMNEDELRSNEKHVDLFGHFLYQYMKAAGFKIVPNNTACRDAGAYPESEHEAAELLGQLDGIPA